MNLTILTDPDLDTLRAAVHAELVRRTTLANADQEADDLAARYRDAAGMVDGGAWVQPTSAVDAYPMGSTVTHGGKTWEATTPACVWEPGVSGWREVVEEGAAPPDFVQPTGAHDAYAKGDRVTFEGNVYESVIDGNAYSPTAYPAGWTKV